MIGIAVAWGLFLFFGGQSANAWLATLFFGAGLGAGTAAFVAWLHIDQEVTLVLALSVVVIVGGGILGSWLGFEYGSTREIECCAMPTKSPIYYTALGSTAVANAAAIGVALMRAILAMQRQSQFHNKVH